MSCALNADGTLKDASEIQWFNDVDDDIPIHNKTTQPAPTDVTSPAVSIASNPKPVNAFSILQKGVEAPAPTRRSTRQSKPSVRRRDAEESTSASTPISKQTPTPLAIPSATSAHRNSHKRSAPSVGDDKDSETRQHKKVAVSEVEEPTDIDEDAEAAYNQTKEMGDADREVPYLFNSFHILYTNDFYVHLGSEKGCKGGQNGRRQDDFY